jgi:hypothetical protein
MVLRYGQLRGWSSRVGRLVGLQGVAATPRGSVTRRARFETPKSGATAPGARAKSPLRCRERESGGGGATTR